MNALQSVEYKKHILATYNYSYEEFQKLEELRGCPIEFYEEDLEDTITTTEYCSTELLQSEPLVSVYMITYNHEKFISEAIEGVVNQKCCFPFELIIGDDCSTDNTLQICLEYQNKYPKIIRLLTYSKNLLSNGFANGRRVLKRCRGKYLAFCEGDDYWTDREKLQKQVNVLEAHPEIGLCCTNFLYKEETSGVFSQNNNYPSNELNNYYDGLFSEDWYLPFQTAGVVQRTKNYKDALKNEVIYRCRLKMGDLQKFCSAVFPNGLFYALPDVSYVYRRQTSGASYGNTKNRLCIDGFLVRYYYMLKVRPSIALLDAFCKYEILTWRYKYDISLSSGEDWSFLQEEIRSVVQQVSSLSSNSVSLLQIQHEAMELARDNHFQSLGSFIYRVMQNNGLPMLNKTISKSMVLHLLSSFLPYNWVAAIWRFKRG